MIIHVKDILGWLIPGVQVYIGDLGSDGTRYELEEAFSVYGAVKNIWVAKKPPGKKLCSPCSLPF